MKKIITALTLFCIISVVISCAKRQNSTLDFPKLSMAMDSNPDSVYNVLTDFLANYRQMIIHYTVFC